METDAPVVDDGVLTAAVFREAGLGTAANLRALLCRHTGPAPLAYRSKFSA